VLVVNKNKPDELRDKILFINADREYAEGKNQNKLRPEDIEKIDYVFTHKREYPKYSRLVDKSEIVEKHDFNLNIPKYVDTFEEEKDVDLFNITSYMTETEELFFNNLKHISQTCKKLNIPSPNGVNIDLWREYKKGVMKKIFNQEIRFKDDNDNDFPDWEEKRLGDVLNYEQPTKYLVQSTEYSDGYNLPVLTAGKSFILGYTNETNGVFQNLPTIIFDDFTTSFHYVDFEFKVKSSAMKMLNSNSNDYDLKFVFEIMKTLKFVLSEHKRYWISEYSQLYISIPTKEEQIKITRFSNELDIQIKLLVNQIDKSKEWKKGLLQKMFM
jgi:hypothetical protein